MHNIGNPFGLLRLQKYYKKFKYANKIALFTKKSVKYLHKCYFFHTFAPKNKIYSPLKHKKYENTRY